MQPDSKFPSDLAERFQVRMPPGLRDRIAAAAETQGVSMNTLIVKALEEKFPPQHSVAGLLDQISVSVEKDKSYGNKYNREVTRALLKDLRSILERTGVLDGNSSDAKS
jgi:hypothetical protein